MKYETIVVRSDDSSVAFVKAETIEAMDDGKFLSAVCSAVTNWVNETEEGAKTFIGSCEDLNIGDLACVFPNEELTRFLVLEGIMAFSVEVTHLSQGNDFWTYDTHIFNVCDIDRNHIDKVEESMYGDS